MKQALIVLTLLGVIGCASTGSQNRSLASNFPLTQSPKEDPTSDEWNFIPFVERLELDLPVRNRNELLSWRVEDLKQGRSTNYSATFKADSSGEEACLSVELSRRLIGVPFSDFIGKIPTDLWGRNLAHYLGGEVRVLDRDEKRRSVRQVERMVLSSLPSDLDANPFNQDMTKAEVLRYGEGFAKVYWRVYHSDNGSTVTDIGSVEFSAFGSDATLVTFHSGHRIRSAFGIPVPHVVLGPMLSGTFLDHLENYRRIVTGQRSPD